ncbi:UNVERIFIED_CONTAM: hypothetical protein PYX00_007976 [Menopon gallinae]
MSKVVRNIIQTSLAPRPQAPYNQAVKVNDIVYLSGVIGMDKTTNKLVSGGVEEEARQVFINMGHILQCAGSGMDKIIKTTIMLNDINDFSTVNEIYKEFVTKDYPARSTYQVGKLPMGARIEVEAIAVCGNVETKYCN